MEVVVGLSEPTRWAQPPHASGQAAAARGPLRRPARTAARRRRAAADDAAAPPEPAVRECQICMDAPREVRRLRPLRLLPGRSRQTVVLADADHHVPTIRVPAVVASRAFRSARRARSRRRGGAVASRWPWWARARARARARRSSRYKRRSTSSRERRSVAVASVEKVEANCAQPRRTRCSRRSASMPRPLAGRAALLSRPALAGRVVRRPPPAHPPGGRSRRCSSATRRRRNLEEDATAQPVGADEAARADAGVQRQQPRAGRRPPLRVGLDAGPEEAVVKEYVRALALSNQLGRVSLAALARSVGGGTSAGGRAGRPRLRARAHPRRGAAGGAGAGAYGGIAAATPPSRAAAAWAAAATGGGGGVLDARRGRATSRST